MTSDIKRIILYFALAIIAFFLWQAWEKEQTVKQEAIQAAHKASIPTIVPANVPISQPGQVAKTAQKAVPETTKAQPLGKLIYITTDLFKIAIDLQGGNLVQANLLKYPKSAKTPDNPITILRDTPGNPYVAESGLVSPQGPDTTKGQVTYQADRVQYELQPGQKNLSVVLKWRNPEGLLITKTFTFTRDSYAIKLNYVIKNQTPKPWTGQFFAQLRQKPEPTKGGLFHLHTFVGAAISSQNDPYQKLNYSKLQKENINRNIEGGWLAMQQRYFLSAWIPIQSQLNHFYSSETDGVYTLGYLSPEITVQPSQQKSVFSQLYVGPEVKEQLDAVAPHLSLTIDFGWLWPISIAILWIMKQIYHFIGNWGWAIVVVTILIKLIFFKLSEKSYRSMARMRELSPKLQAIKERLGDDRQKMSQATMELYRKEKVNPLGGCLPMLIQIPFFIALYYVLSESVQLRQAPFIFWIKDLSVHDPYYVLPILMGVSMFLQQRLNPAPPDPTQAKVMMFLPVIFTLFFLGFPAGLVLYWLVNNIFSGVQQWMIIKRFEKKTKSKKIKVS